MGQQVLRFLPRLTIQLEREVTDAIGGQNHHIGAPEMLLRSVAIPGERGRRTRSESEMVYDFPVRTRRSERKCRTGP